MYRWITMAAVMVISLAGAAGATETPWTAYGGSAGGGQYSPLTQIDRNNVGRLRVAWSFHTGERGEGLERSEKLTFEDNPLMVDGRVYVTTATSMVFALDAVTGRKLWTFDAHVARQMRHSELTSRGVSTWLDAAAPAGAACRRRLLFATLDTQLLAIDAATGLACGDFGVAGKVDLRQGIRIRNSGDYQATSPPVIVGDVAVIGSSIGDNRAAEEEQGTVRAYDVRTGRLLWAFDPIPRNGGERRPGGWDPRQAATVGAANAWPPLSADPSLNLVYVPTGSASPDYVGSGRTGDNRDANSLVALDARDGHVVWRQQLVHHDLWDYDLASQPALARIDTATGPRDAVVQGTKMGFLFAFDRRTGEPVFPIEEKPVPASDVPGEAAWPTQPFPEPGLMLARHAPLSAKDAWGITPWERDACAKLIGGLRSDGVFTPPSTQGTVVSPGYGGGTNWGGVAIDAGRQIAVTTLMDLPMQVALVPRDEYNHSDGKAYPGLEWSDMEGAPFGLRRGVIKSPLGIPCTKPAWGKVVAVDLKARKILWEKPLGDILGRQVGLPAFGGATVTAGGLVFVAASMDKMFRALDVDTGRTLWSTRLPFAGNATPSVYAVDGKQFVVIAAGGHGPLGTATGDMVVAYTLDGTGAAVAIQHPFIWSALALLAVLALLVTWWRRRRRRRRALP